MQETREHSTTSCGGEWPVGLSRIVTLVRLVSCTRLIFILAYTENTVSFHSPLSLLLSRTHRSTGRWQPQLASHAPLPEVLEFDTWFSQAGQRVPVLLQVQTSSGQLRAR